MKKNRREQYDTAEEIRGHLCRGKNVLVDAEEKSGKRVIVEILALLDWEKYYAAQGTHGTKIADELKKTNIYVTGLNRKDCKVQLGEMKDQYDVTALALSGKMKSTEVLRHTAGIAGSRSTIHIDECDYASSGTQALSPWWQKVHSSENCNAVLYSATPEECIFSAQIKDIVSVKFQPSPTYRGAAWYLEQGLVREPAPFWDATKKDWTEHGQTLIDGLLKNARLPAGHPSLKRRIGVVRLSGHRGSTDFRSCYDTIRGAPDSELKVIFVDKDTPFEWGDENAWLDNCSIHHRDRADEPKALLIVICATCTRSTELKGHEFLKFWHDNRSLNKCQYSTLSQALGRIKHYGGEGNPIEVYSDIRVFKLNCGLIPFSDVKNVAGRTKSKVVKSDADSGVSEIKWVDEGTGASPLEWRTDQPTAEKCGVIVKPAKDHEGKWANFDGKFRCMDNCPKLGGAAKTKRNHRALVYKSPTSNKWTMRTYESEAADREVVAVPTNAPVQHTHNTKPTSMFVKCDTTPPPDLSDIDDDIRSMGITTLKYEIRTHPQKKRGDLGGSKAELQKTLNDIRKR